IHLHWRKKITVGQYGQTISITTNPYPFFHIAVPRGYIGIRNRPIYTVAILAISPKIQFTESVTLPAPRQGASTYLISSEPIKRFYFLIRAFLVINPKIKVSFVERVISAMHGIILLHLLGNPATVFIFPGMLDCCRIVFDMF